nr:30S ribosomal protein S13 [Nanoarchaeum sp.]
MTMEEQKIKFMIRIFSTDLDGSKPINTALRKVKGISFAMSNAICHISGVDREKKAGLLTDEEVKKIELVLKEVDKFPVWMLNRRKDYDDGKDVHLVGVDLKLRNEFDIKRLRKIKSYRGSRHANKQPSRGQRTKAHFRSNKKTLGVKRKK